MGQVEALALTLGIEVPLVLALVALARWLPKEQWLRLAIVAAAASLLTHPFAWWANTQWLTAVSFELRAGIIEGAVVLLEALIYAWATKLSPPRAFACALVANASSFGIGLLLA